MGYFRSSSFIQTFLKLHNKLMVLKTTEDLRVCPGINDPTMINTAERKEHVSLYQVDSQRSIVDGKIRSTRCSHILANESKVRCHECQVFLRSNMRLQNKSPPESTQSKPAHDSHVNLSRLSRAELITRAKTNTKWLPKPKVQHILYMTCTH